MDKKIRIDQLLFERGLAESRSKAQRLVMAGQVRANDQVVPKPSSMVAPNAVIKVASGHRFVSRGGEKLEAAFDAYPLDVAGKVCVDVGASTGGFSDCLLKHGASKVYAIDVGKGILHWKLRTDPRVVVMEETNARYVEALPEPVSFASIDASFISLKILTPVMKSWFVNDEGGPEFDNQGDVVALIKPQFEAGRKVVAKGKGVIRDPIIHQQVLSELLPFLIEVGYTIRGLERSPVLGPKGNVEFLVWLQVPMNPDLLEMPIETLISRVLE